LSFTISKSEARYLALSSQLLLGEDTGNTKKDLLKIIERLGYIQIDTISIVERAHKHVLWTRFPSYRNQLLDELIDRDKKVFEFWDHAASYLPLKNFRHSLRRKENYSKKYGHWAKKNARMLNYVLDRIKNEGPLESRDFQEPGKRGTWWEWKPAKDALEYLFHSGELMVRARKNFRKVYDLTERILPSGIDTTFPEEAEHSRHLILTAVNANGFASLKEITYLRENELKTTKKVINELAEEKKINQVNVKGIEFEYYTSSKILNRLNNRKETKTLHILSPFDNLVIQRKRLKALFDFDYLIECYLPAHKRQYGYFCLPVLYGNKFIGRMDAKADRAKNEFKIINFFPENNIKIKADMKELFEKKIKDLANFAGINSSVRSINTKKSKTTLLC
jgi:uncharacterized protein YcaQ